MNKLPMKKGGDLEYPYSLQAHTVEMFSIS
jgi:hypothetical protein